MGNEKQAKVMADYYWHNSQKTALIWELLKDIRRHETAFISDDVNNRYYHIGTPLFLNGQIKARFVDSHYHQFHFFHSIECVSFVKSDGRVADLRTEWNPYGIDLCFDFDCKGKDIKKIANKTKKEAYKIIKYLDNLTVPITVNFSGSKGMHVRIGWKYLEKKFPNNMETIQKLAKFICKKAKVNTKPSKTKVHCDLAIVHSKGLIRTLLSLHPKSLLVALPLTRDLFKDFDINTTEPKYIMENFNLRNWIERAVWNPNGSVDMLFKEFEEWGVNDNPKNKQRC